MKFVLNVIRWSLWLGLTGLACVLVFGLSGHVIKPLDSFSHFQIYYVIGFACSTLIAFVLRFWRLFISSLTFLVISLMTLGPASPLYYSNIIQPEIKNNTISIISYNLYYRNQNVTQIEDYFLSQNPDVILLQEVSRYNEELLRRLNNQYPHQAMCITSYVTHVAILSKHKPSASGCLKQSRIAWLELNQKDKRLQVGSFHLVWPWPFQQWQQIEGLTMDLVQWNRPINSLIIGGDFNAVPWSAAVETVESLTKAKVVPGLRFTLYRYMTRLKLPLIVPIDHILAPANMQIVKAEVGPDLGSDHRPVHVVLQLK